MITTTGLWNSFVLVEWYRRVLMLIHHERVFYFSLKIRNL
jgi:hypothetical protein